MRIILAVAGGFLFALLLFEGIARIVTPPQAETAGTHHSFQDEAAPLPLPAPEEEPTQAQTDAYLACLAPRPGESRSGPGWAEATRRCKETLNKDAAVEQAPPLEPTPSAEAPPEKACGIPYFCRFSEAIFIQAVYTAQFLALWLQTAIVLYLIGRRQAAHKFDALSRWATDAPPVLGVAGTLYAFAMAAALAEQEKLSAVFRASFDDAVMTTLIGILVFVINLALNIFKDVHEKAP